MEIQLTLLQMFRSNKTPVILSGARSAESKNPRILPMMAAILRANKMALTTSILALSTVPSHAQYQQINLTVFGMDCAPCAHAIHVSMKGILGVDKVDVDLNTGLVAIQLTPDNSASMRQFNQAVEKNGFTHKDAVVTARGKLTGTAVAPIFEVEGTQDRFALVPATAPVDLTPLLGKTVTIQGTLPQAPKGKVADTLRYNTITEAR